MPECSCLPKCPFFHDRMENRPATAKIMKEQYCLGDNSTCARFVVSQKAGTAAVPADLFPSQSERIAGILEKAGIKP